MMRRRFTPLAAAGVSAVAMAAFAGGALADSGHGNSGNAPGQQKKEQAQPSSSQTAQPTASTTTTTTATTAAATTTTATTTTATTTQSQPGVKPSSTTSHDTKTQVGDSPDVSKRYGNGSTAAEIAKSHGAPATTEIRGPGNSQPHKVLCGGRWVDVHAVKSYASCTATASTTTATTTTPTAPAEHKVTLCHATGSSTNPYVLITVDYHALKAGHTADKGDIIPPTTIEGVTYSANWTAAGQAIFNNGCKALVAHGPGTTTTVHTTTTVPATTTVHTTTTVPTVTTVPGTTTVHTTTTMPAVTTVPAATVQTTTAQSTTVQSTTVQSTTAQTTTAQATTGHVTTQAATTTVLPQVVPATTTNAGGVLGAQTTRTKPQASGGVLGTVTTVAGGTLPFTGFPVWLAVLVAIVLLIAGFALRRRSRTMGSTL